MDKRCYTNPGENLRYPINEVNMYLIVGLGNPGDMYAKNRHNAGFMALDYIKVKYSFDGFKKKDNYKFSKGKIHSEDVVLVKPQTFMNLSGQAVTKAMSFFKIQPSDLVVIYDDVALPFGRVRIRETGSPGGHNGLKDIEKQLGSKNYTRVRIGVDPPPYPGMLADFVLGDFSKEQIEALSAGIFDTVVDGVNLIIQGNIGKAMNEINGRDGDQAQK